MASNLLTLTLWTLVYLYGFWLLYVLVMGFYRAKLQNRLSPLAFVLAMPFILLAFMADLIANLTIASFYFLQWPRHPLELVTDRLSRYMHTPEYLGTWRANHAELICTNMLDVFDPSGLHCKPKQ